MTKLCPRGKAAAKRKFKVYPSAYANAYASKICAGKIKDPSGVRRKDFKGPKPAGKAIGGLAGPKAISQARRFARKMINESKAKKRDEAKVKSKMIGGMAIAKRMRDEKMPAGGAAMMMRKKLMGLRAASGGVAKSAGAHSAIGRLEKAKMMSGGFGIFSKSKAKNKEAKKESNESKKKKRLKELKGEIDKLKQGGMGRKKVVSIFVGKVKDYPGAKKVREMNKKGKKKFSVGGMVDYYKDLV